MTLAFNILFQKVGGLIYLTWLFKGDLKRVISSYVLILFCALVHLLCMFLFAGGDRGWVHRDIKTQNSV